MALWQDIPGKDTKINRKNLSRLEKFTQATCEVDSDYFVNFDGASGLDNYDIVKIAFINAIDEDKQARLSIDNGTTFYDIKDQLGKDVQGKEIELIFKTDEWEIIYHKNMLLVAEYIVNNNESEIVIDNLDISSDGDIYEIETLVRKQEGGLVELKLKLNELTSYFYGVTRSIGSSNSTGELTVQGYYWNDNSYFGFGKLVPNHYTQIITTISKSSDGYSIVSNNNLISNTNQFFGVYAGKINTNQNLTKLTISPSSGSFYNGSRVRIWRK